MGFNNGKLVSRYWRDATQMIKEITEQFLIHILPLGEKQMETYARLRLNLAEDHRDPSDHVIISHAINDHLPLISSDSKFLFYRNQGLELIYNSR